MRHGFGWRVRRVVAAMVPAGLAIAMVMPATPAAAATPNHSLFLAGRGRAETGVLKGTTYTRKKQFAMSGVSAAAATRTSLAIYTKGSGKLRTGTFRNGVYTPVETVTLRTGFTHAVGSCDSLLLYNSLTGRALSGTLVSGRLRNRSSFFLPVGLTSLGSSCDTTWFSGPNFLAVPPNGVRGTLSGGDWRKTGDVFANSDVRVGMSGTSYIAYTTSGYAVWGSAVGGVLSQKNATSDNKTYDIFTGAASTMLYYDTSGYACVQRFVLGVPEPAACAPNIVTNGWAVITGGR